MDTGTLGAVLTPGMQCLFDMALLWLSHPCSLPLAQAYRRISLAGHNDAFTDLSTDDSLKFTNAIFSRQLAD